MFSTIFQLITIINCPHRSLWKVTMGLGTASSFRPYNFQKFDNFSRQISHISLQTRIHTKWNLCEVSNYNKNEKLKLSTRTHYNMSPFSLGSSEQPNIKVPLVDTGRPKGAGMQGPSHLDPKKGQICGGKGEYVEKRYLALPLPRINFSKKFSRVSLWLTMEPYELPPQ